MEQCMSFPASCETSLPPLPKPKSVLFSPTAKKPVPSVLPSKKWDGLNQPPPYKLITLSPMVSLMIPSNKDDHAPSTCVFIGFAIVSDKAIFASTGKQGTDNLADYFTKHHSPEHHRTMLPLYLHTDQSRPTTTTTSTTLPTIKEPM